MLLFRESSSGSDYKLIPSPCQGSALGRGEDRERALIADRESPSIGVRDCAQTKPTSLKLRSKVSPIFSSVSELCFQYSISNC